MISASALLIGLLPITQLDPLTHQVTLTTGLDNPARVAVTAAEILVTDPRADAVVRFDLAGTYLGTWPEPAGPVGIAVAADGRIFVSRRDDAQVGVYDATFTFQHFLAEGVVSFVKPTDLAVDPVRDRLYVVDTGADRFYGFNSDESLALIVGIRGSRTSEFKHPTAIAVDTANDRLVVADQDNFRVQVFGPSGVWLSAFGYRIKYLPGGSSEGWMPRTAGLAVDSAGNIYVSDGLMSTLRIFNALGAELGKVLDYGSGPGQLHTPGDVELDGAGRVLVANGDRGGVEIYDGPSLGLLRGTRGQFYRGTNKSPHDDPANLKRVGPLRPGDVVDSGEVGVQGGGPPGLLVIPGWDPPHMEDDLICGRCHDVDGQPGGHLGTASGQANLCLSCHTGAGQAAADSFRTFDAADPYGTNPNAVDGQGSSHAWGVPAVNATADSVGPASGGEMELHLDNGDLKCATCHEQHNNDAGVPFLRINNNTDQMCKECHAPRNEGLGELGTHPVGFDYPGGVGEFPADAAVSPLLLKNGNVECMTCHAPHYADSGGANGGSGDGMLLRGANDDTLCQTCHTEHVIHTPGGPWQPTCTDCHDPHDPSSENLSLVARQVNGTPMTFQDNDAGTDGLTDFIHSDHTPPSYDGICEACHTQTAYHRNTADGNHSHNAGTACTACHPHNTGFMPLGGSSCIGCHSGVQGSRPAVVNADGTGGHHLAVGGGPLTDGDCVVCHEMSQHQGGTVRLWSDPNNPTTPLPLTGDPAELVAFCDSCHVSMTHPVIHTVPGVWDPVCTECHELHDPANVNLSLVRDLVYNQTLAQDMAVVFTQRTGPNSFNDGDPAVNDGICQVCHTTTAYHLSDGTGTPHNDGTDCTGCHPHANGFVPSGGTSCTDCHNSPQDNGDGIPPGGRRAVVGEFALASHHLQGASLDPADCTVCHEMSQHQAGHVRLKDVDDPSNPAAVTVLDDDPSANQVEAVKLEAFCLACHDADGAGGSVPFSDGVTPPSIDASMWAAASHKLGGGAGAMTCFGDGETFGCHSTGHGSAKRKLLAPPDASQAPVPGDDLREEEGMCYTCHDADGPASTDLEAQFALAHRHNVSSLDQGDGSRVECTDCHNPHTASASALLADPDTGIAWTGGGADFCLVCHDGTPPAGVFFPATASGTGYDKSAYPGTTHASLLGPSSCVECHEQHGSADASLLKGQYVIIDDPNTPYSAGSYAACWICHDETATIQDPNAFKNLHNKHVVNERAPCYICHDAHRPFDVSPVPEEGLIEFGHSVQQGYDIEFIDGRDASTSFWIDGVEDKGYCYIRCHDKDHKPKKYDRINASTVDCLLCHVVPPLTGGGVPPGHRWAAVPIETHPDDLGNSGYRERGEVAGWPPRETRAPGLGP